MTAQADRLTLIMAVIMIITAFVSLGLGKYSLPVEKLYKIIISGHLYVENELFSLIEHQVVWNVRMPRILTAMLAGGGLALCGAALQGVFYNPLVDPHIIGVTSGAAFGGTLAILAGVPPILLMLSSFVFGLFALALVYFIAKVIREKSNLVLVLAGVILSGFFGALVSMTQYLADTEEKLPNIVFWLMGSFATARWSKFVVFAAVLLAASFVLMRVRWHINVLSLGDKDAKSLGMKVGAAKWLTLVMCAVIVAAQVAVSGSIGWIGLIIPHLARIFVGVDHRKLLPIAFIMGGTFMVVVDDVARLLTGSEIPIGIVTAVLGAPVFLGLLIRESKRKVIA